MSNVIDLPEIVHTDVSPMVISFVNLSLDTNNPYRIIQLDSIIPEDVAYNPSSPIFSSIEIPGRSSPPQTYGGGDPATISFTITLHRDMMSVDGMYYGAAYTNINSGTTRKNDENLKKVSDSFESLLNQFKAFNYPVYSAAGVIPPKIYLKMGDSLRLKGYCSTTFSYRRPVDLKRFMVVDVTFSFTEVTDISWSATEVIGGFQRYVYWSDKGLR